MDARSRRLAAIVFFVAVLTNFAYLAWQRGDLVSDDSPTYIAPARQLAGGAAGRSFRADPAHRPLPRRAACAVRGLRRAAAPSADAAPGRALLRRGAVRVGVAESACRGGADDQHDHVVEPAFRSRRGDAG